MRDLLEYRVMRIYLALAIAAVVGAWLAITTAIAVWLSL